MPVHTYLWAWDSGGPAWVKVAVDSNGLVKVDLSAVNLDDLGDVYVPTPTDEYLLYWDAPNSRWACRALVDADIPAAIARDAEVATAVSDHAALTTGIHGVGARHVAETTVEDLDLAAHLARHEFDGGDVLAIPKVLSQALGFRCDWQTHDGWTEAHSGTGQVSWGLLKTILSTAGTQNSIAKIYAASAFVPWRTATGYYFKASAWSAGLTSSEVWLGLFQATTPTPTVRHIGWFIEDGLIYASNADGTTQTITSTGITKSAAYSGFSLFWDCPSEGTVRFYVDGVLKATHTTNVPTAQYNFRPICYIKNDGVAADRNLDVILIGMFGAVY